MKLAVDQFEKRRRKRKTRIARTPNTSIFAMARFMKPVFMSALYSS